jgi:hypothetical protein
MLRKLLGTISLCLLALFAFPKTSEASIWDIIWGMSGPQMMGPVLHCEWDLQHKSGEGDIFECRAIDYLFHNQVRSRTARNVWMSLDSGFYFSTGKDSGDDPNRNQFRAFETFMVAFEPMLEVRSHTSKNIMLYHGLMGVSYGVLFGKNFDTFDNVGLKFRPIGVAIKQKYNASFTLRYYPRRFVSEDFGIINPTEDKTDGEFVYGFTVGWLWGGR